MHIHGSCHCGNIAFDMEWPAEPTEIPARACDCSFCMRHGGVWTSNPAAALKVSLARPEDVSRYAFGTSTAVFHVCGRCGVVPLVTSEIEGHLYAVVNVNAFDNVAPALLRHAKASFDEEDMQTRLARRQRSWISQVQFLEPV